MRYIGHPKHFLSYKEKEKLTAGCQSLINNDGFLEMRLSEMSNLRASYKNCGCQAGQRQA